VSSALADASLTGTVLVRVTKTKRRNAVPKVKPATTHEKAKLASETCKNNDRVITNLREILGPRDNFGNPVVTEEDILDIINALRVSIKMLDVVVPENRFELDTEAGLIDEIREMLDLKESNAEG
jgi:hypothetical protein